MRETIVLRLPRLDEEGEFLRAHRATTPEVPYFLHYYEEGMSFARYLEVLDERARGLNLPPGHVPSTFLFVFKEDRIIGRVAIRHRLNDLLLRVGGHIGYVIVPEFRRRGHATASLRLALDFARFASDSYVAYQKMQIDLIREKDTERFITHNLMGFAFDQINYFDLARDLDFVSWDS